MPNSVPELQTQYSNENTNSNLYQVKIELDKSFNVTNYSDLSIKAMQNFNKNVDLFNDSSNLYKDENGTLSLTTNQQTTEIMSVDELFPVYQFVNLTQNNQAPVYFQNNFDFAFPLQNSASNLVQSLENVEHNSKYHIQDSIYNLENSKTQFYDSTYATKNLNLINECLPEFDDRSLPYLSPEIQSFNNVKELEESYDSLFRLVTTEIFYIGSERINAVIFRNYSYNTDKVCKMLNDEYPWIFNTISAVSVIRAIRKKICEVSLIQQKLKDCVTLANFFV